MRTRKSPYVFSTQVRRAGKWQEKAVWPTLAQAVGACRKYTKRGGRCRVVRERV